MKPKHRTKIKSGYVIAFLLLVVSYFMIFYIVDKLVRGTKEVADTYTMINKLESLHSTVLDADAAVKGFMISRENGSLMPYYASAKAIPVIFDELFQLASPLGIQQERLTDLRLAVDAKMDTLASNIRLFQASGLKLSEPLMLGLANADREMVSIRKRVNDLKKEKETKSLGQQDALTGFFNSTYTIAITSLVIAILTSIFSLVTYNREKKARDLADKKVSAYHQELENKLQELKKVNAELKIVNAELQELKQIEKFAATGRIARTIAHEVRNPLTNISLAAEQLHETFSRNEESALLLDMVSRNASRIDHLVSDLLHSTRFAQLDFVKVDVNELLDEALGMAQDRIGLKNIRVIKEYSQNLCDVMVDPEKMKLALLNMIVNAIEAIGHDHGVLKLKTSSLNNKCLLEISDNGSGMDEETLQKVFDPYFTGKSNGTGLGLTNSQNIIFNHKGKVTVKSEPGRGSTFQVSLDMLDVK
jgi:signal transduction histidine kinase